MLGRIGDVALPGRSAALNALVEHPHRDRSVRFMQVLVLAGVQSGGRRSPRERVRDYLA
jgi:hypothetical protein